MRELKKLMKDHSEYHVFLYFIAYGFRSGVHEEVRAIRGRFKELGSNITLKLIELRYGNNLREEVFKDLLTYLGSRVSGILKSDFRKSNGMVFSRLKHLLDYCLLILTYVKEEEFLKDFIEDLAGKVEVDVREYRKVFNELTNSENLIEVREKAISEFEEVV